VRVAWSVASAFDQAYVAGPRPFLGVFGRELDPLPFPQQLENRTAHGAAVEEVLDSTLVADEPEPFVDEKPGDCPGWHTRKPSVPNPWEYPKGVRPVAGAYEEDVSRGENRPNSFQPVQLENAPV
jgi:hypothetical protein